MRLQWLNSFSVPTQEQTPRWRWQEGADKLLTASTEVRLLQEICPRVWYLVCKPLRVYPSKVIIHNPLILSMLCFPLGDLWNVNSGSLQVSGGGTLCIYVGGDKPYIYDGSLWTETQRLALSCCDRLPPSLQRPYLLKNATLSTQSPKLNLRMTKPCSQWGAEVWNFEF